MNNKIDKIKENIAQVIVGKNEITELLLTALIAEGHVLLNDVPGTGKTKLAHSLACSIEADFKRIQFTPDLQPADITGLYYFDQKEGDFKFRSGPILNQIILADEINRAVPRTQASLLEAMEERQVTIEGNLFKLKEPFMVLATQNPVEMEGTFDLPEAQLDRFLFQIELGYPDAQEELTILQRFQKNDPLENLQAVSSTQDILALRKKRKEIKISEDLLNYIINLCRQTRQHKEIKLGVSPRGTLALMKAAQAYALIQNRDYVLPDDIKYLFPYIAVHRILLDFDSQVSAQNNKKVITDILEMVEVPVEGAVNG